MDFFDRHKALIITSLLFAVLFLALYNLNLSNKNRKTSEMLVSLDQLKMEEKEEEAPKEEVKPSQQSKIQTNQAFNENKEDREADFQKRLDEIFQKNTAEQKELENEKSGTSEGDFSIRKKNAEKKQNASEGDKSGEQKGQQSAAYDYSSISFSLKGRNAIKIPNPVYTCDTAGKIVVNISVDENGYVTDLSINKNGSTSSNECLIERALEYAAGARFTKLAGQHAQPGTITYYFRS
ncbi:hypothetical protein C7S20_06980 [Christiangramia fulva]|uniref:Energy transducer TonB n=1 Tax=Christiangramia fulva TaxID=2126553 RepID=A0A2R3Z443_9FLAO|nr:hypothetical protein [Christiangramia fulva]AVR45035.1 hypothetical protein C7S20_06980 [Christiangramia fulva]